MKIIKTLYKNKILKLCICLCTFSMLRIDILNVFFQYCKYYLVKFCPHDLFVNTRADLGACPKVHDDEVKKLFDTASNTRKLHYQEEFIRFCSSMVAEVESNYTLDIFIPIFFI